jgi:hypothetical protein
MKTKHCLTLLCAAIAACLTIGSASAATTLPADATEKAQVNPAASSDAKMAATFNEATNWKTAFLLTTSADSAGATTAIALKESASPPVANADNYAAKKAVEDAGANAAPQEAWASNADNQIAKNGANAMGALQTASSAAYALIALNDSGGSALIQDASATKSATMGAMTSEDGVANKHTASDGSFNTSGVAAAQNAGTSGQFQAATQ